MMRWMRWMNVLLFFLQCVWITHCYLYTGTPCHHSIHWTIPHSTTTTTTITTTTNTQAILATQRDYIFTDSQKLYHHHQHSRSMYLCMQSRRSPQSPARPTTPSSSSSSVSGSSASTYLLPTPPVNSIGNFFDQSTLVPSSSSSSDDSGSDSSGGGMSFIQCHMIAVGEIEGNLMKDCINQPDSSHAHLQLICAYLFH